MAYITNDGARLIGRARNEGKSIVFGSVRMNTIYKSDPSSLVQKSDEWFGAYHGSVVGCLSHVSVNDVSCVCDSKLAIQCNDNSESWKSLGIYARLNGEEGEVLFACESIQNGEYKDVTIVELPVTLDGAVEDFGLSEGSSGSGGSGGGGGVPENMMTTNTEQTGLIGMKQWAWDGYDGEGSEEEPLEGDRRLFTVLNLGGGPKDLEGVQNPLRIETAEQFYSVKEGGWVDKSIDDLRFSSHGVYFNNSFASWSNILNAARNESGFSHTSVVGKGGVVYIGSKQVKPNTEIKIGLYAMLVLDSNGDIASIHSSSNVLDISAAVYDNGSMHRVSGIVSEDAGISFDSPITPAEGQEIYIHWTRYV